jgi:hypothetical protein
MNSRSAQGIYAQPELGSANSFHIHHVAQISDINAEIIMPVSCGSTNGCGE